MIYICRLQAVGDRPRAIGRRTAQSADRRQAGRLQLWLTVDVGSVGRESDEGKTWWQHRIRLVVRVSVPAWFLWSVFKR